MATATEFATKIMEKFGEYNYNFIDNDNNVTFKCGKFNTKSGECNLEICST